VENEKGWKVKKLGDLALVKTGPFGSMLHKEDYISNGIPLVNPIHMKDYQVKADINFTVTVEKAKELSNYLLKWNDVVFARRGDIGRCAVVSEKENGYLCGTGSLFVRFIEKIEPIYMMYIIRADSFTNELISKAKGATMLNLNSNTIASLLVPLPPLSLQQSFAARINAIEQQKQRIRASIKDLETLLASRMQYWFD
jgi:type I restriction enzyme S subunit